MPFRSSDASSGNMEEHGGQEMGGETVASSWKWFGSSRTGLWMWIVDVPVREYKSGVGSLLQTQGQLHARPGPPSADRSRTDFELLRHQIRLTGRANLTVCPVDGPSRSPDLLILRIWTVFDV